MADMNAKKAKQIHDLAARLRQEMLAVIPPEGDADRIREPFDTMVRVDFLLEELVTQLGHPAHERATSSRRT